MDADSLLAGLSRANARLPDATAALRAGGRVDLAGTPSGVLSILLGDLSLDTPALVITPDLDTARRMAADLSFFLGEREREGDVLLFPSLDSSPYLEVAPDRRATMDRLSVLFHLARGLETRFVVAPATAISRRLPPRDAVMARSAVIRAEEELDREELIERLSEGGYLRVPVAEDPGTFAVRGALLDIYPPRARYPYRIELDDWLVLSIQRFDPDTQRSIEAVDSLFVHPVRDTLLGKDERERAARAVRQLCDEVNLPTRKTRQLLEEIESGRVSYGLAGLLPAFYPSLDTLFDYLPMRTPRLILDPAACVSAVREEYATASSDRVARVEEGAPAFSLDAHYTSEGELLARISEAPLALCHRYAALGVADASEGELGILETCATEKLHLGGESQSLLAGEIKARRKAGLEGDVLLPLVERTTGWLEAGMHVLFTAHTGAQAERLRSLLKSYEIPVEREIEPFARAFVKGRPSGKARVVTGALSDGFLLASEGVVFLTEEEIFGARARRRKKRPQKGKASAAFVEDLRELLPGDYVVHHDHGVGRYIGLEKKEIALSAYERMQGLDARAVEVLVIEYAQGDRLFLPVTRLSSVQKYAGKEGHAPKLDRLGGQSFAKTKDKVHKAVRKLADDLLRLYAERAAATREPLGKPDRSYAEFEATFPFEETPDQANAIDDVMADLEAPRPMDRLVCGDVGFGKTEVALRAAFRAAMAGRQVALLCPTTVLAQQHFLTFRDRFADYPLRVEVLSRFVSKKQQTETLTALKDGRVDVVIGTHRLLSKDVHFARLGLLIVDEEQRFGVAHKERIKKLRSRVDVLTLSATPIPRTLSMAIGGLRDLSLIKTAPVDRRAVRTFACRWDDHLIREAIRRELSRGGQVFFVYNRIEGLYERAQRLGVLLPEARIAVAHGQMKEGELERAMSDFIDGRFDILCSTAIIESGLDIPRANTMIVDRADIFGLSQLYQIRGRVGRSRERAYCYLVTPPPSKLTDEARARMEALERFTELGAGFHVASMDMELRGAGDLLGAEQSGTMALVGFELFVAMLEEAVAELRGAPLEHRVDTEMNFDLLHHLGDDYVADVGLRLSFYKRLSQAEDAEAVAEIGAELEDRFGPLPGPARELLRVMSLGPALSDLKVLGCEASKTRVMLHLAQDTPLEPAKVMRLVARPGSSYRLTPDMKLSRHFAADDEGDSVDHVSDVLRDLGAH